jgi:hypothetical protein
MLGGLMAVGLSLGTAVPQHSLKTVTVVTGFGGGKQHLPVSMCQNWPIWISAAGRVSEVPGTGHSAAEAEEPIPTGFVNPASFEQLWCPEDLPLPSCSLGLGTVLKVRHARSEAGPHAATPKPFRPCPPAAAAQDGAPVYMFPCLETSIARAAPGGQSDLLWHNRGLNSVPLGSTWMGWGKAGPPESLILSSFSRELPPQVDGLVGSADVPPAEPPQWEPLLEPTVVGEAVRAVIATLADAPDAMGKGYQYLVTRLPGTTLPAGIVRPGRQLGLVLADGLCSPDLNDLDWQAEAGCFGAGDIAVLAVPPGGQSEYMPEVYRALYEPNAVGRGRITGVAST